MVEGNGCEIIRAASKHLGSGRSPGIGSRLARVQVVPCIIADIVGALGLVYAEKVDGASFVRQRDAEIVAVDRSWPVCDAVCIDMASQNADAGAVAIVRRRPNRLCCSKGKH